MSEEFEFGHLHFPFSNPTKAVALERRRYIKAILDSYPAERPAPIEGQVLDAAQIAVAGQYFIRDESAQPRAVIVLKTPYKHEVTGLLSIDVRENEKCVTLALADLGVVPCQNGHWRPDRWLIVPQEVK